MTDEQINAAIFEAIKQRDQARRHYNRIYQTHHKTKKELKDALEFINALKKENEELMKQVGSLMFMIETIQHEINKLQK